MSSTNKSLSFKNLIGFTILLPIFILIILFVIVPLIGTLFRSFTSYNYIQDSEYIRFENYKNLFNDDVFFIKFKNTLFAILLSTTITVGIAFLFAWVSSKLQIIMRYILSILFLIASITYIFPFGIVKIFSNDNMGYVNAYLISQGKDPIQFLAEPMFLKIFMILIPILIGLGPLYLLFTICFMNKSKLQKYFHIATSLQIIITLLSYNSIHSIVGLPSPLYKADLLTSHLFDYLIIRYEGGYAAAISIFIGILIILMMILFNGLIWLVFNKINYIQTQNNRQTDLHISYQILIFILLILIIFLFMYPYFQALIDSFKPLEEILRYPPKLLVENPTLENYDNMKQYLSNTSSYGSIIINSTIPIILSSIVMFIIILLSGVGFSLIEKKIKKPLLWGLTVTFILTPIISMYFPKHASFDTYFEIVFQSLFKGVTFGLSIYFGYKIFENNVGSVDKINQFQKSPKLVIKYTLGVLALSLLTSLSTWFNFLYRPTNIYKFTLFQRSLIMRSSGIMYSSSIHTSLYILSLRLPILIIIIATPLVLYSLSNHKNNSTLVL